MVTYFNSIELDDRYGDNTPSLLRACFECEAMGWYPIQAHGRLTESELSNESLVIPSDMNPYELSSGDEKAISEHIFKYGFEQDGWYFLECPECGGRGTVSWPRSIVRIPSWLWRGMAFIWETRRFAANHGLWANLRMSFYCAYVLDILRLLNIQPKRSAQ